MFWTRCSSAATAAGMRQKELGIWRSSTWDAGRRTAVREIADGLLRLGFEPRRDAPRSWPTPCVEWVLADLAILCAGGVSNGIYPTDAAAQVEYLCDDSRTVVLFVEDEEQLDKVLEVRDALPRCARSSCSTWRACASFDDPGVIGLDALRELGRDSTAQHPGAVRARARRLPARRPRDPGLHLGHHRPAQGRDASPRAGWSTSMRGYQHARCADRARRAHVLPAAVPRRRAHRSASTSPLYTGSVLNFVENPETVPENVREIAPTVFTAVPRVWEKFYSGVMIALKEAAALQQLAYALGASASAAQVADAVLAGQPVRRVAEAAVPARALAGAGQRAQHDRHPPRALAASPARRRSRPT